MVLVNIFSFSKTDFELRYILHSERGGLPDHEFPHAVLSENVRSFHEHEQYKNTVAAPRVVTVV